MQFGLSMALTDGSIAPAAYGRAAEELGFESVFVGHHSHIPVSDAAGHGGRPIGEQTMARTLDPLVALTAVAAATERVLIGTSILLVAEWHPISLAKALATLDQLSSGRLVLGIGAGWNAGELADHGVAFEDRYRVMREHALAVRAIWQHEEAQFHGEFVDFPPIWSWPKPARPESPPILVGGSGPSALAQVLEYATGWLPSAFSPGLRLAETIAELRGRAASIGRPTPTVTLLGPAVGVSETPDREALVEIASAGVDRCLFVLPSAVEADVVAVMRRCASVAAGFG